MQADLPCRTLAGRHIARRASLLHVGWFRSAISVTPTLWLDSFRANSLSTTLCLDSCHALWYLQMCGSANWQGTGL